MALKDFVRFISSDDEIINHHTKFKRTFFLNLVALVRVICVEAK